MFENPMRSKQARNFTTNVPKILDPQSSSEQIFFRKLSLGAPATITLPNVLHVISISITLHDASRKLTSSETQGQLVGSIKCSCWKLTVRSRRAPGHLLLPNQFQKRLNCLLLIGQKKFFLANQRREAAGWLSCVLTRRSFPHRSPWLRSAFNGESFSRKGSEQNVNNPQKFQPLARLQETNTLRWIFRADLSKVS